MPYRAQTSAYRLVSTFYDFTTKILYSTSSIIRGSINTIVYYSYSPLSSTLASSRGKNTDNSSSAYSNLSFIVDPPYCLLYIYIICKEILLVRLFLSLDSIIVFFSSIIYLLFKVREYVAYSLLSSYLVPLVYIDSL